MSQKSTEVCRNCGKAIHFNKGLNFWIHTTWETDPHPPDQKNGIVCASFDGTYNGIASPITKEDYVKQFIGNL